MKNLKKLGLVLPKNQQKSIIGGDQPFEDNGCNRVPYTCWDSTFERCRHSIHCQ